MCEVAILNTDPEFGTEKLLERAEIEKTAAEERKSVTALPFAPAVPTLTPKTSVTILTPKPSVTALTLNPW